MEPYKGNLKEDGIKTRGWLIGHFIEDKESLRYSKDVEIKWGDHKKGEERTEWSQDNQVTIATILIKGQEKIIYEDGEIILKEGEYLITPPNKPHKWVMLEDSVVVTVKWLPSVNIL